MRRLLRRIALALVVTTLATGTVATFGSAAPTRRGERERRALGDDLLRRGITRIYTDYWTCDYLAFQTQERIICAVVGDDLQPGHDRYPPYRPIVEADPDAAYAVPLGSPQAVALARTLTIPHPTGQPQPVVLHGYLVVQPLSLAFNLSPVVSPVLATGFAVRRTGERPWSDHVRCEDAADRYQGREDECAGRCCSRRGPGRVVPVPDRLLRLPDRPGRRAV